MCNTAIDKQISIRLTHKSHNLWWSGISENQSHWTQMSSQTGRLLPFGQFKPEPCGFSVRSYPRATDCQWPSLQPVTFLRLRPSVATHTGAHHAVPQIFHQALNGHGLAQLSSCDTCEPFANSAAPPLWNGSTHPASEERTMSRKVMKDRDRERWSWKVIVKLMLPVLRHINCDWKSTKKRLGTICTGMLNARLTSSKGELCVAIRNPPQKTSSVGQDIKEWWCMHGLIDLVGPSSPRMEAWSELRRHTALTSRHKKNGRRNWSRWILRPWHCGTWGSCWSCPLWKNCRDLILVRSFMFSRKRIDRNGTSPKLLLALQKGLFEGILRNIGWNQEQWEWDWYTPLFSLSASRNGSIHPLLQVHWPSHGELTIDIIDILSVIHVFTSDSVQYQKGWAAPNPLNPLYTSWDITTALEQHPKVKPTKAL